MRRQVSEEYLPVLTKLSCVHGQALNYDFLVFLNFTDLETFV